MNNVLKFLLLAAGCVIVIVFISLGYNLANKGKADVDTNVDQYNTLSSKYEDMEKTMYDGAIILGSEVKQIIRNYADDEYLSIVVKTNMGSAIPYIQAPEPEVVQPKRFQGNAKKHHDIATMSKSESNYINDRGRFLGEIYYDDNDVAACLWFEQQ